MTATIERATHPSGVEAPLVLDFAPPKPLTFRDQLALWGNLGISLFGPITAVYVISTPGGQLTLVAAWTALIVGVILGGLVLGAAAVPAAHTGAPAMANMRGLFGRRGSYLPATLNILQNIGWATVEIVVIATAAAAVTTESLKPLYIVLAGLFATAMAVRPLGSVRTLRKYAVWVVIAASVYLYWQVLRQPLVGTEDGSWSGFWLSVDVVIAIVISFAPLAGDYSRHSRSGRAAFAGAALGYGAAAVAFVGLGLFAFFAIRDFAIDPTGALLALPAGAIALVILLVDEVDEAFANIYSTTMSTQNMLARIDRRLLAVVIGAVATGLAFVIDLAAYQNFLFLIGAFFVPLFAVVITDYFVVSRRHWELGPGSRMRWGLLVPWLAGFLMYELFNPSTVAGVDGLVERIRDAINFTPPAWIGASAASFLTAAVLTLVVGGLTRRREGPPDPEHSEAA
jgi:nucleobase:cation symporter-1, NCS1 family